MNIVSNFHIEASIESESTADTTGIIGSGELKLEIYDNGELVSRIEAEIIPCGAQRDTGKLTDIREKIWWVSDYCREEDLGVAYITKLIRKNEAVTSYLSTNLHSLITSLSPVNTVVLSMELAEKLRIPSEKIEQQDISTGTVILSRW